MPPMLRKFPSLSRFYSKLFYELLPAAIASAVGGMVFNHYTKAPVATPPVAIVSPASAEMLQMVRDEHAVFVDYLKKNAETRLQAELAAEQDAKRISVAEQAAREARAAETHALALAAHATERPEKKLAVRQPTPYPDKVVPSEPLQLHAMTTVTAPVQPAPPLAASPMHRADSVIMAKLRGAAATVERVPSWVRSATDWFSGDAPPRPPAELSPRNFLKASM
jgi:hypothetical protein